jgi:alanine racemase
LTKKVFRRAVFISRKRIIRNYNRIFRMHSGVFQIVVPEAVAERFMPALAKVLGTSRLRSSASVQDVSRAQVPLTHLLGVEGEGASVLTQAIWLVSHVLGVRRVKKGEAVSYGGEYILKEDSRIGLVPVGFADGIDRILSGKLSICLPRQVSGIRIANSNCVVVGRIAMDSISFDLGNQMGVKIGQQVEIFGPRSNFNLFDAAVSLGVEVGEVALRLGERAEVVLCR